MGKGRPSAYTDKVLAKAQEYVEGGYEAAGDPVPTVAALACELGVTRDTVYRWAKEHSDFSDVMTRVKQVQERALVSGGLRGDWNPQIARLMLSAKHGYSEKTQQEHTSPDGSMSPTQIVIQGPDDESED